MATNFGIGGDFLSGLALTSEVSDTDLKRIVESPEALHKAAQALREIAANQRQKIVESKKNYSLEVSKTILNEEVAQLLRDAGYRRISKIMEDWPSAVRERAMLSSDQMVQVADMLRAKGAISDVPDFPSSEDPEPTDLDNA